MYLRCNQSNRRHNSDFKGAPIDFCSGSKNPNSRWIINGFRCPPIERVQIPWLPPKNPMFLTAPIFPQERSSQIFIIWDKINLQFLIMGPIPIYNSSRQSHLRDSRPASHQATPINTSPSIRNQKLLSISSLSASYLLDRSLLPFNNDYL